MEKFKAWLDQAARQRRGAGRPVVSLCYAQGLDGSLAARRGQRTVLSGPESSRLTHRLRRAHQAILVGVDTLLADDPRLTARLPGPARSPDNLQPQPVVLDTRLRTPPTARLLKEHPKSAWIACCEPLDPARKAALEGAGARLLRLPPAPDGRVDLPALLDCLGEQGVATLMVEGGARVITSFLVQGLADLIAITVAPVFLGGLAAVESPLGPGLRLRQVEYARLGDDWVVYARLH